MGPGAVSSRVALLLRSVDAKPVFYRFEGVFNTFCFFHTLKKGCGGGHTNKKIILCLPKTSKTIFWKPFLMLSYISVSSSSNASKTWTQKSNCVFRCRQLRRRAQAPFVSRIQKLTVCNSINPGSPFPNPHFSAN